MKAPATSEVKTLLLTMRDGGLKKKITVPSDWKATFGPLVPGAKDGSGGSGNMALRLWSGSKGSEKQHAVFTGVESFRDTSIVIEEEIEESRQETFRKEGDAEAEAIVAEVKVKRWVNPDKPAENSNSRASATSGAPGRLIQLAKFGS